MKSKRPIVPWALLAVALGFVSSSVLPGEPGPPPPQNKFDQRCLTIVERAKSGRAEDLARLRREFPNLYYRYQQYALEVLEEMGAPGARELLLDIALGKVYNALTFERSGAWRFWKTLDDRGEARCLFEAPNPEVREKVLEWMREASVPVDSEMLRSIEPLLQDTDLSVRFQAAMYLQTAPGSVSGIDKARALIRCAETTDAQPDAGKPGGFATDIARIWTMGGMVYRQVIEALVRAERIDLDVLREVLPQKPGVARDCVLIAMARHGATEIKSELYRILRQSAVPMIRDKAVAALDVIGTAEDIPKLEQVAQTDTFRVSLDAAGKRLFASRHPGQPETPDAIYPIRDLARTVAERLESKWHGPKKP